jgi:predicted dehydrogenase
VAAMIGAGNFAKMTMAPALSKTAARRKYVSELENAAAAAHVARKYGFEFGTTDPDEVWNDHEVNTVFIATGHSSHAALICRGLNAGKHVFVEKPLALDVAQVRDVLAAARQNADRQLMVGFNRRFSPHVRKIRELLSGRDEPLAMHFNCNAGIIPADAWVHDPQRGGGRIIGEACHFIDLLSHITGSRVVSVAATKIGRGV